MRWWVAVGAFALVSGCQKGEEKQSSPVSQNPTHKEGEEKTVARRGIEAAPTKKDEDNLEVGTTKVSGDATLDAQQQPLAGVEKGADVAEPARPPSGTSPVTPVLADSVLSKGPYVLEVDGMPRGNLPQAEVPELKFKSMSLGSMSWEADEDGNFSPIRKVTINVNPKALPLKVEVKPLEKTATLYLHWIHEDGETLTWWTDEMSLSAMQTTYDGEFAFTKPGTWTVDIADSMSYIYATLSVKVL